VELSTRLSDQLSLFALGSVRDGTGLIGDLTALVVTLSEAVSGYAGLRLTLVHDGHPVQLTAMFPPASDQTIVTSVRLPLDPVSSSFEEGGELVVWSSVPGSLVDLAADVGYVLHDPTIGADRDGSSVVELDADLPRRDAGSGVHGLDELATVNRAAGVLIGQGQDPRSVQEVLRRRAAEQGLSAHAWAVRLLREHQYGTAGPGSSV
jgi:hypothetical protein